MSSLINTDLFKESISKSALQQRSRYYEIGCVRIEGIEGGGGGESEKEGIGGGETVGPLYTQIRSRSATPAAKQI